MSGDTFVSMASRGMISSRGQAAVMMRPERLMSQWPFIEKMMEAYPDTLTYNDPETILHRALEGHIQGWEIGDSKEYHLIAFTQVLMMPRAVILDGFWLGGKKLFEYIDLLEATLTDFGDSIGATVHHFTGRPGWEKLLGPHGYRPKFVTFERMAHEAPWHII